MSTGTMQGEIGHDLLEGRGLTTRIPHRADVEALLPRRPITGVAEFLECQNFIPAANDTTWRSLRAS
jgi:hypothetical protein